MPRKPGTYWTPEFDRGEGPAEYEAALRADPQANFEGRANLSTECAVGMVPDFSLADFARENPGEFIRAAHLVLPWLYCVILFSSLFLKVTQTRLSWLIYKSWGFQGRIRFYHQEAVNLVGYELGGRLSAERLAAVAVKHGFPPEWGERVRWYVLHPDVTFRKGDQDYAPFWKFSRTLRRSGDDEQDLITCWVISRIIFRYARHHWRSHSFKDSKLLGEPTMNAKHRDFATVFQPQGENFMFMNPQRWDVETGMPISPRELRVRNIHWEIQNEKARSKADGD